MGEGAVKPERIEELLGGYATNTLTPEERRWLMDAALQDQRLFDALMDEEALRETLTNPEARAELLRELRREVAKASWWRSPWPWTALATATAAIMMLVVYQQQRTTQVAVVKAPVEIAANLPQPEPVPLKPELVPIPVPKPQGAPAQSAKGLFADATSKTERAANAASAPPAAAPAAAPPVEALGGEARLKEADARVSGAIAQDQKYKAALESTDKLEKKQDVGKALSSQSVMAVAVQEAQPARNEASPEQLRASVAFMQGDGSWADAQPDSPLPRGRALRLTVTSEKAGMLVLAPPLAPETRIEKGKPVDVVIPAQAPGELALRLSVVESAPAGADSAPLMGGRADAPRAMRQNAAKARSAAISPSAPLVRELRLRIE
jgi:hypothetical protein